MPKLSSEVEASIIRKLNLQRATLKSFYRRTGGHKVYYSRKVGYFLQVLDFQPRVLDGRGRPRPPSEFKEIRFPSDVYARLTLCCLNSSLFYWFVTVYSDCRHVNKREVDAFPVDLEKLAVGGHSRELMGLAETLMIDLNKNSEERVMRFKHDTLTVQCIFPKRSHTILQEIDVILAMHYGLTSEELDFIVNYDTKYRMGQDSGLVDEERTA